MVRRSRDPRSAHGLTTRERDVIRSATSALLPATPPLAPDVRTQVANDVAGFVASLIVRMPATLRVPYRVALLAFDTLPVVPHRRSFRGLDPATQQAWLRLWSDRGGTATRSFVKLLRSCALFAFFDHPQVIAALGAAGRPGAAP